MSLVIGFDLDLTLVDSAEGIVTTLAEAARRLDAVVEPEILRPMVGLPLDAIFSELLPVGRVDEAVALYRELYPSIGIPSTKILPGAAAAIHAIHDHRGSVVVISAKIAPTVRAVLDHVDLTVDDIVGDRFADTKGEALRECGASVYVGDHPGDMVGARAADAYAMGVTTGWHDAVALRQAGADVVLADLLDFPYWLADFVGTPT